MNVSKKDIEREVLKKLLRGNDVVYGYVEQTYMSERTAGTLPPGVSPQWEENAKITVEFITYDENGAFRMMNQNSSGTVPRYALVRIDD